MKKILVFLLMLAMIFTFAACGGGDEEPVETDGQGTAQEGAGESNENQQGAAEMEGWMKTKTGQFYSQFEKGEMYMEYEMEYDGQTMTVCSATKDGKNYSDTIVDGKSLGATIMDGETMYVIDHNSKTVMKMSIQTSPQEVVDIMIEEGDYNPEEITVGTREIEGKTYDTEEITMEDSKSIQCFDGDKLAYMIAEVDGEETVIKVIKTEKKVDDSLFEIPKGYEVMSI